MRLIKFVISEYACPMHTYAFQVADARQAGMTHKSYNYSNMTDTEFNFLCIHLLVSYVILFLFVPLIGGIN